MYMTYGQGPYGPYGRRRWLTGRFVLRLVGGIFAAIGIGFLLIGLLGGSFSEKQAAKRTATAQGLIVDVEERTSRDSDGYTSTSYFPVIEFEDSDHVRHRATQNVSSGRYQVGASVEVQYEPTDPEGNFVMTDDADTSGFLATFFSIFGGVFALLGLILFIVSLFVRA